MDMAIKIISAILPLILEIVKKHNADQTTDAHHDIVRNLINEHLSAEKGP